MRVNELHSLRNLRKEWNAYKLFKCQALFLRHGKTEFWLPVSVFVCPRHRNREFKIFHFRFPFFYYIVNGIPTSIFFSCFPTTLDNRILVVVSVFRFLKILKTELIWTSIPVFRFCLFDSFLFYLNRCLHFLLLTTDLKTTRLVWWE